MEKKQTSPRGGTLKYRAKKKKGEYCKLHI